MDRKSAENHRRSSILKGQKPTSAADDTDRVELLDDTATSTRTAKRVSFAASNYIKPFMVDEEKATIWDTTYEERAIHGDSTESSQEHTNKSGTITTSITSESSSTITRQTRNNNGVLLSRTIHEDVSMELTREIPIPHNGNLVALENTFKGSIIDFARKLANNRGDGKEQKSVPVDPQEESLCHAHGDGNNPKTSIMEILTSNALTVDKENMFPKNLTIYTKTEMELTCCASDGGISPIPWENNPDGTVYDEIPMDLSPINQVKSPIELNLSPIAQTNCSMAKSMSQLANSVEMMEISYGNSVQDLKPDNVERSPTFISHNTPNNVNSNKRHLIKGAAPTPSPVLRKVVKNSKQQNDSVVDRRFLNQKAVDRSPSIVLTNIDGEDVLHTPQNVNKRQTSRGLVPTPSPVPRKVTKQSSSGWKFEKDLEERSANVENRQTSRIPVSLSHGSVPKDESLTGHGNVLYSQKLPKTKLLNTPIFDDLKTPETSYKINVDLMSPCIDDTDQLINCTLAKSDSYVMASSSSLLPQRDKDDTFARSIVPEISVSRVTLPNLSRFDENPLSSTEASPNLSNFKNKLTCVNDTYVLNHKKMKGSSSVSVALDDDDDDDDWIETMNVIENVAIFDESSLSLHSQIEEENFLVGNVPSKITKCLCQYHSDREALYNVVKATTANDRIREQRRKIDDLELLIMSIIKSIDWGSKSPPPLLPSVVDGDSINFVLPTGGDDTAITLSSDQAEDLFTAIKKMEKDPGIWKLEKAEDDVYYFAALNQSVFFTAGISSLGDYIADLNATSNIKSSCQPIFLFINKVFVNKLEQSRLKAALGAHYDIVSLLTYVEMIYGKLLEFYSEFFKWRSFGLELNEHFIAKFRLHSVPLIQMIDVTVDFNHLDCLEDTDSVITSIIPGGSCVYTEEFLKIAKVCPKGLDFIDKFISQLDSTLKEHAKLIL